MNITNEQIIQFKETYKQIVEIATKYCIIENELQHYYATFSSLIVNENHVKITLEFECDYFNKGCDSRSSVIPYPVFSNIMWDYELKEQLFERQMAHLKQLEEARKLKAEEDAKKKEAEEMSVITNFFQKLADNQEKLPAEFEKILKDNYWDLLEK